LIYGTMGMAIAALLLVGQLRVKETA
jgi:hypothetical protein